MILTPLLWYGDNNSKQPQLTKDCEPCPKTLQSSAWCDGRRQLERRAPSFPCKPLNLDYHHGLGEAGFVQIIVHISSSLPVVCELVTSLPDTLRLERTGVWAFWSFNVHSQYHFLKLKEFLTLILHCIITSHIFQEKLYQAIQPFLKMRGFYSVRKPWSD